MINCGKHLIISEAKQPLRVVNVSNDLNVPNGNIEHVDQKTIYIVLLLYIFKKVKLIYYIRYGRQTAKILHIKQVDICHNLVYQFHPLFNKLIIIPDQADILLLR